MTRFLSSLTAASMLLLLGGCSEESGTNPPPGNDPVETTSVSVVDSDFDPDDILVDVGATVTWTWNGSLAHDVTFNDASLSSSSTKASGTHTVTFNNPGTYSYYCTVHGPLAMGGSVTVE